MKTEIRGLPAGYYYSDDGSILFKICKTDQGAHIEVADFDGNVFYAAIIDENGKTKFECGQITQPLNDDNRKEENGED